MTTMSLTIENARVLTPDGELGCRSVTIDGETVGCLGDRPRSTGHRGGRRGGRHGEHWSAAGALLLPGIVDLHGDGFERQIMPRPGVHIDLDIALHDTDRQMIASGITTALHAVTCSWEPGLRGRETVRRLLDAIERLGPAFACDTRVHLRHETYNLEAEQEIAAWLADGRVALLAFNDHMEHIRNECAQAAALARYADRSGLSMDAFTALLDRVAGRAQEVRPAIERLARAARDAGIPGASHDDEAPETRRWFSGLKVDICEFPPDAETARTALALGGAVVMGAPNVIRGGSHAGRLPAAEASRRGLCSILTSDYYYPSVLCAPFRPVRDGIMALPEAWALVSHNPARVLGFDDRGEIAPGQRADLIVVDDSDPSLPRVTAAFVAGRAVYAADKRTTIPQTAVAA